MTKGKIQNLIWRCAMVIPPKGSFFGPNAPRNLTKKEFDMAIWYFKQIYGQDCDMDEVWAIKIYTEKGFEYNFRHGSWGMQCSTLTSDVVAFGYLGQ